MILHRLTVRNYAGLVPGAVIERFGDGITLVHGPNEAGKSTLLRALCTALFQRHKIGGEEAEREMAPVGRKLTPEVEVEFSAGGTTYRLVKTFFSGRSARLDRMEDGAFKPLSENDAADGEVIAILGASFAGRGWSKSDRRGAGQILLADQGQVVLDELGQDARDHLAGALGRVAQTAEAKGLTEIVAEKYGAWFTETGRLRGGAGAPPLVRFEEERAALVEKRDAARAEIDGAEEHVRWLQDADARALEQEALVAEARAGRAVARDRQNEAHALDLAIQQIEARLADSRRQAGEVRHRLAEIARLDGEAAGLSERAAAAGERLSRARTAADAAADALAAAREARTRLDAERIAVEEAERLAADGRRLLELRRTTAERAERLAQDREQRARAAALQEDIDGTSRPRPEEMRGIRDSAAAVDRLAADLARLSLRVRLTAESDVTVEQEGQDGTALPAGSTHELTGDGAVTFRIPGTARIHVTGPAGAGADRDELAQTLAGARESLDVRARPFGTADMARLEELTDERAALVRELDGVEARRRGLLPDDAARREAEELQGRETAELTALLERRPDWAGDGAPAAGDVDALSAASEERRETHRTAEVRVDARRVAAEEADGTARTELEEAREAERVLAAEKQRVTRDLTAQRDDGLDDEARQAASAGLDGAVSAMEEDLSARRAAREALGEDPAARVDDADREVTALEGQGRSIEIEKARREVLLRQVEERGSYRVLSEAEEQIADLDPRIARARLTMDAVRLLHSLFAEESRRAVDQVLEPVRRKVERMVRAVFGDRIGVRMGESFLPEGHPLSRGDGELAPSQLSFGTRDQVALLVRVAYAEVLARDGERQVLVLDDPLVHVDRDRRRAVLEILRRSTRDLQVVILTCHPEQYASLGDDTVRIAMDDARAAAD